MLDRDIQVAFPASIAEIAERTERIAWDEWIRQAIELGFDIDRNIVTQAIGGIRSKLGLADLNPISHLSRYSTKEDLLFTTLSIKTQGRISQTSKLPSEEWLRRAVRARIFYKELQLEASYIQERPKTILYKPSTSDARFALQIIPNQKV